VALQISLHTFSELASVFFVITPASSSPANFWTEDVSLARNQFPGKTICDQIRLSTLWCLDVEVTSKQIF